MAERFDPYHIWLGIPPEEQPPNFYRLLGIPLFSDDPDVIESAADRQMRHLKTFQLGKLGDFSQKLLNEVAAAKVCLLDAQKRAAYDRQLRQQMQSPQPAIQPGILSISPQTGRAKRRKRNPLLGVAKVVAGGIAGLALGIVILWYGFGLDILGIWKNEARNVSRQTSTAKTHPSNPAPQTPQAVDSPAEISKPKPSEQPEQDVTPTPVAPTPETEPATVENTEPPREEPLALEPPPEDTSDVPLPFVNEPRRLAVPTEETQQRITAQLLQIHNLNKKRNPVEKVALAAELFNVGKNAENPGEKYVLLDKTAELAAEGCDAALTLLAVDTLGTTFEIDLLKEKARMLNRYAVAVKTTEGIQALISGAGRCDR